MIEAAAMNKPTAISSNPVPLREQALDWFVRRNGVLPAAEEAAFQDWLRQDVTHQEAYRHWEQSAAEVDQVAPELRALLQRNLAYDKAMDAASGRSAGRYADAAPVRPGRRKALTLAGYAALSMTSGGLLWRHLAAQPVFEQSFATARGEQSEVPLPDGTVLRLDTATRIAVTYYRNRRELRLAEGQIMLAVQKDAERPFQVLSGAVNVTVVGTHFSVRNTPQQAGAEAVEVAVSEGKVKVDGAAASTVYLTAGQQLSADARGMLGAVQPVSQEQIGAWQHYHLRFLSRRLDQVLAEMARYRDWPLLVRDPQVAALQLTGVFDPRDVQTFQRVLPLSLPVRLVDAGDGRKEVVMRR